MKTTKDQRGKFVDNFDNLHQQDVIDLSDDIDTLTEKLKARDALLERAKDYITQLQGTIRNRIDGPYRFDGQPWLADLASLSAGEK